MKTITEKNGALYQISGAISCLYSYGKRDRVRLLKSTIDGVRFWYARSNYVAWQRAWSIVASVSSGTLSLIKRRGSYVKSRRYWQNYIWERHVKFMLNLTTSSRSFVYEWWHENCAISLLNHTVETQDLFDLRQLSYVFMTRSAKFNYAKLTSLFLLKSLIFTQNQYWTGR